MCPEVDGLDIILMLFLQFWSVSIDIWERVQHNSENRNKNYESNRDMQGWDLLTRNL